jgi:Protein of unknown function (DUF3102)
MTNIVTAEQCDYNRFPETPMLVPAEPIADQIGADTVATDFDYALVPDAAAELARRTVDKIRQRQQRISREIIEIGSDLLGVKDALGHGHFCKWLEAEFGWTDRTARNYMRAAGVFASKSETVSVLPPATLYLLSAKSTPKAIIGEVIAKLEQGERVDPDDVEARVEIARQERHIERSANKRKMSRRNAARRKLDLEQRREDQERRQAEEAAADRHVADLIIREFTADKLPSLIAALSSRWWASSLLACLREDGASE